MQFDGTVRHTDTGLFGRGSLVALMTLAVVRSRCVDTVSVNTWITHTFIHVWGERNKAYIYTHTLYLSMQASACTGIKFLDSAEDGSAVHKVSVSINTAQGDLTG